MKSTWDLTPQARVSSGTRISQSLAVGCPRRKGQGSCARRWGTGFHGWGPSSPALHPFSRGTLAMAQGGSQASDNCSFPK